MAELQPVSVRIAPRERRLLEAAADRARTNLSDFIRRHAVAAAEMDFAAQSVVTIPASAWKRFETWAGRPARRIKGLRDLARTRPAWRD